MKRRTVQVQRNMRKPMIAAGRAYRVLSRHYAVRQRLLRRVWKGPLVDALMRRPKGVHLRAQVALMVRQLRRLEKQT